MPTQQLGTRFKVAANEAIRLADSQAGEESQYTFGDMLAEYQGLAVAVKELAEQLDKGERMHTMLPCHPTIAVLQHQQLQQLALLHPLLKSVGKQCSAWGIVCVGAKGWLGWDGVLVSLMIQVAR